MNWKETYTKIFLKELGQSYNELSVKEHMPLWWHNTRNKEEGGLRLTETGMDLLTKIDLATYDIPFPADMPFTTQVIIFLDKFIDCPYYIGHKGIQVTNQKKAVELTLFSGDMRKYGLSKALNRQNKDNKN
ncbi:hypothetical protein N9C48_00555 [bacterium]|nr:hypothetical protein [bacterium]